MAPKDRNKKQKQAKQHPENAVNNRPDPSVACFAVHPMGESMAVAVHNTIRISNLRTASTTETLAQTVSLPIRAVAFDASGKYLLVAGDEKLVQVWNTESWKLIHTIKSPKKVTAAVFGNDSSLVAFADKFGDIHTAKIQSEMGQADPSAFPLLGHLCSIVTSLAFSLDGKHLVSTDQDCKVRVSTMPSEPQKGAHSIQSICMGHQVFAKCCAFISTKQSAHPLLLSGGGDSTVRSWEYLTGKQLDCFTCVSADTSDDVMDEAAAVSSVTGTSADGGVLAASATLQSDAAKQDLGDDDDADLDQAEASNSRAYEGGANRDALAQRSGNNSDAENLDAGEDDDDGAGQAASLEGRRQPAVLSISAAPDGCTVAAAVEGRSTLSILHCAASGQLSQQQELQLPGVSLPTQVQFDAESRLWVVGGPLPGTVAAACIAVASCSGTGSDRQWRPDEAVLSAETKAVLERRQAGDQTQISASTAIDSQQQINQQLRKRVYSAEEREARKKNRNDSKS